MDSGVEVGNDLAFDVLPVMQKDMKQKMYLFWTAPTFVTEVYRGPYGNPALKRVDPFR